MIETIIYCIAALPFMMIGCLVVWFAYCVLCDVWGEDK